MSLSCSCDDYAPQPGEVLCEYPHKYSTLATNRAKRCTSCGDLIPLGSIVAQIRCWKVPDCDVEEAIYGMDGEVPRANRYLCERCADLCFSLMELGFCFWPAGDMRELLDEYVELSAGREEDSLVGRPKP